MMNYAVEKNKPNVTVSFPSRLVTKHVGVSKGKNDQNSFTECITLIKRQNRYRNKLHFRSQVLVMVRNLTIYHVNLNDDVI